MTLDEFPTYERPGTRGILADRDPACLLTGMRQLFGSPSVWQETPSGEIKVTDKSEIKVKKTFISPDEAGFHT